MTLQPGSLLVLSPKGYVGLIDHRYYFRYVGDFPHLIPSRVVWFTLYLGHTPSRGMVVLRQSLTLAHRPRRAARPTVDLAPSRFGGDIMTPSKGIRREQVNYLNLDTHSFPGNPGVQLDPSPPFPIEK